MKTLRKNDPEEYWKILKTGKSTKQPDIEFKEQLFTFSDVICQWYNFFFRFNIR
jgi:hypothetical protein